VAGDGPPVFLGYAERTVRLPDPLVLVLVIIAALAVLVYLLDRYR